MRFVEDLLELFYIYNKINPKYPANTISIYGNIAGMPLSYTSYIDIKSGQFLVLKCEIGIEKKKYLGVLSLEIYKTQVKFLYN